MLCSWIGEPSFECISVFRWDITFKTDALAVAFGYWPDKATAVRCELQGYIPYDSKLIVKVTLYLLSHQGFAIADAVVDNSIVTTNSVHNTFFFIIFHLLTSIALVSVSLGANLSSATPFIKYIRVVNVSVC